MHYYSPLTTMETKAIFLILSSIIVCLFTTPTHSSNSCKPEFCDPITQLGPLVRFPFRLQNRNPTRCGYPGFDLYCNSQNQTILNLPLSGEFIVDYIDYNRQALYINDPDFCLPNRILNLSLSGSPFRGDNMREYTFMNCSSSWMNMNYSSSRFLPLFCLSGGNYTVVAMNARSNPAGEDIPASCRRIDDVMVPMQWAVSMFYWSSMDMREDLELVWRNPGCWECENQGGVCGFEGDSGLEIGCSRPARRGIPRGAKYGIIIGLGIPGLLCIIGSVSYAYSILIKSFNLRRSQNSTLPTVATGQRLTIRSASGLDGSTIESYPMTVLGESRRLPNPSDTTCPICLSDYEAKETIKSIPACNHYFHADCIDEWLKLNGSCPLCRNLPESSSTSPFSSMSTTSDDRSVSNVLS